MKQHTTQSWNVMLISEKILYGNIVLSGGTSMYPGINTRLEKKNDSIISTNNEN